MQNSKPIFLGVNIDHVATVRQARGAAYPNLVEAALLAERAGADAITVHLREDRRHIQDRDVELLQELVVTRINLELAVTEEMLGIACRIKPSDVCLVPEKRAELTTEGGLDVAGQLGKIQQACDQLAARDIRVSLFIDPVEAQIDAAIASGAPVIELHTGAYADALSSENAAIELERIRAAADYAQSRGICVNAGHGLHYFNVKPVAAIEAIRELNIGHAIVSRALFDGLGQAVKTMKALMHEARHLG